eukprot:11160107-Lingulodinium_polyedra.AAC.1
MAAQARAMAQAPAQAKGQTMLGRSWATKRGPAAPRRAPVPPHCSRRQRQLPLRSSPRRRGAPGPARSSR